MAAHLSRAALTERESYGWIHALAGAYVIVVGAFAVAAWVGDGEGFRAVLCAGAQVLAIACAILARRSFTGEMPWMGALMVAFTLGCAYWSALGIRHAWEANGQAANDLMVGFLAALEPLLFLAAEHIKEGREALRERAKRDEEETRAALEAARQRDAARQPFRPEVVEGGRAAQVAALVGAVALGNAGEAAQAAPMSPPELPPKPQSVAHSQRTWAHADEHAAHLLAQGVSQRQVAATTGLSRWQVRRLSYSLGAAA